MTVIDVDSKYVRLSFEDYLGESVECFKSISAANQKLEETRESFYENINFLKRSYSMQSTEDGKEQDKKKFGTKVKEFIIKAWSLIVSVFSKIVEIVVYLIKSIIIFVQKKLVQFNSIYKIFQKHGNIRGFNNANGNIIVEMLTNSTPIKTITNNGVSFSHDVIVKNCFLRNTDLEKIVKQKLTENSRNTATSIQYIRDSIQFKKSIVTPQELASEERKLGIIEEAVDELYRNGVYANMSGLSRAIQFYNLKNGSAPKIDNVAHQIVLGIPDKKYQTLNLFDYFKGSISMGDAQNKNVNWDYLEMAFEEYYKTSELVLGNSGGKKGYVQLLEANLKEYKEMAKRDKKLIDAMNKDIILEINKIMDVDTPESKSKFSRINKITNIITKVKNIKTHYIRFRQQIIIDILSVYSIENKAWWALVNKGKYLKRATPAIDDDGEMNNLSRVILKRPDEET